MKAVLIIFAFSTLLTSANADIIYALGTSNTNCKNAAQAYTKKLGEILPQHEFINGGVDGDKPKWMLNRLKQTLENITNIKLVIFEPGPNEPNKEENLAGAETVLLFLKSINMKTIYVSNGVIQNKENAAALAEKYGATYYGPWTMNVPVDREHRQYDMQGPGHMTVKGCELWAQFMAPVISQALENK